MKRFGLMFALAGMAAVLMNEEGGDAGNPGGGPEVKEPVKPNVKLEQTQEQLPKEEPGADEVLDKAGFAKTEDHGLNYALGFLAKHGFTADNPAVDAAFGGDFSLLKAELAQKGVAGWEQALALGEQAYGRAKEANDKKVEAAGKVVTEIAEQAGVDWNEAIAHVGTSATPEQKTALNTLLGDPATASIAATFITNAFLSTGQSESEPLPVTQNANAARQETGGGPISRREYTAEMAKLRQSLGDNYLSSPQAQALYKRLNG